MERKIYFSEDDFCQRELLPIENLEFCKKEMNEIEEFAEEHQDNFGFTDTMLREENPNGLKERKIEEKEFRTVILEFLPAYDIVETGYGTYWETCKNIFAFGKDEEFIIFYQRSEGKIEKIWIELRLTEETSKNKAEELLILLGEKYHLLLADWGLTEVIDLRNQKAVQSYLQTRLELELNAEKHLQKLLSDIEEKKEN